MMWFIECKQKNGEIIPIEVKSTLKIAKVTRSFRNFLDSYSVKQGFIFSYDFVSREKIGSARVDFRGIVEVGKIV